MADCPHGLDDRWCGPCLDRTRPKPKPEPAVVGGHPFEARFSGPCCLCPDGITPGDLIRSVDDDWAHTDCADALT